MKPLTFNPKITKGKPDDSDDRPFCQAHELANILEQNGTVIRLENKYRTSEETYQTVITESDDHWGEISNYTYDYNRRLIRYAMEEFSNMQSKKRSRSVAMFRNSEPLPDGSLRHPHLQIVGSEPKNIYEALSLGNFKGVTIRTEDIGRTEIDISTKPTVGFCEFNIIANRSQTDNFADGIKNVVMYLPKDHFLGNCRFYNFFSFRNSNKVVCKVVPRFVVSPYYVGYKVLQLNDTNRLAKVEQEFLAKFGSYYDKG